MEFRTRICEESAEKNAKQQLLAPAQHRLELATFHSRHSSDVRHSHGPSHHSNRRLLVQTQVTHEWQSTQGYDGRAHLSHQLQRRRVVN